MEQNHQKPQNLKIGSFIGFKYKMIEKVLELS